MLSQFLHICVCFGGSVGHGATINEARSANRSTQKNNASDNKAVIIGSRNLIGADCISSDLRTTFSIILGAIAAKGSSNINRVYHGERGLFNLVGKLKKLGVKIKSDN